MNLKTFTAPTMIACLGLVKHEMGPTAVILHTRTYSKRTMLGFKKREYVEITAGKGLGGRPNGGGAGRPAPTQPPAPQKPRAALPPQVAAYIDVPAPSSSRSSMIATAPTASSRPGTALLETPVAAGILGQQVVKDLDELKKIVGNLVDTIHKKDAPTVPDELINYYLTLVQNEVAEELANDILQSIRKSIRPEYLSNEQFVKDKIAEHVEKLIPTTGPIQRTKTVGPHVVALIGPTGVGKTTTIAKLAANLKLIEKRRVGLITIDTYRIAAIDQLRKYAQILGSNLRAVGSAEELREAVRVMSDCEYILIDTAGRSPRDSMRISELKSFLEAVQPDEVHLVLSTTASQECVEFAMERFGEVNFDKVIFTKLDEAAHVGTVLNVVKKLNKSLSYITTGQNVPKDIEVGQGRKLAQWILGAPM